MKSGRQFRFYILIALLFLNATAFSYHIAGGEFTYRWISGNTFEIKLTLYRDCSNPVGSDFDQSIIVGIYNKGSNLIADSTVMSLSHKDSLALSGAGCSPPPQVCMQYGEYVKNITLPPNPSGYYIVWERCCRNSTIANLANPDELGMVFYAEIPDPSLHSSSPLFKSHPLPYICVEQFFRFGFQATDADGDSLVYVLSTPTDGGHTSQNNPNPFSPNSSNPSAPFAGPYTNAVWAGGYSLSDICGSAIPLTLNSTTGEIEVVPDFQGIFAMAVEVHEYRNGVFIGLVRREIEFYVIACTGNSAPQLPPVIAGIHNLNVYATDTIHYDIKAVDFEGDSVFLIHDGDIFPTSHTLAIDSPYALSANAIGLDSAVTYFTWNTGCQHISSKTYHANFEATDNGCPLMLTSIGRLNIKVNAPPSLPKSNLLCIELIDSLTLKITRVSYAEVNTRYFSHFILYRSINGSPFTPYKYITDNNPVAIFDSAAINNRNNDYCYFLSSFNNCGMENEHSDTLCSVSHLNLHKNYIQSVSVIAENNIELKWEPFNTGIYSKYYIYKRQADEESLQLIKSFDNYGSFNWIDSDVETNERSYCYAMINEDVCGNESDTSLIACTILLNGTAKSFINELHWSEYINWREGVEGYDVMRRYENSSINYSVIASLPNDCFYFDRDLPSESGIFYYYIKAKENGSGETSFSNEIILEQPPFIFTPSAFSPNNDGNNDAFFSKGSYVKEFEITIYDRWGQVVFSSDQMTEHWDGMFKGKQSPVGIYFYKMKYKGFEDVNFTESAGSITLLR